MEFLENFRKYAVEKFEAIFAELYFYFGYLPFRQTSDPRKCKFVLCKKSAARKIAKFVPENKIIFTKFLGKILHFIEE